MLRTASLAQKPLAKDGFIRHLPFFLSDMTEFRSLPAIADVPFRDKFKQIAQTPQCKEKAAFYSGCLIDFAYPEMGEAVVKILNKAGIEVSFPKTRPAAARPRASAELTKSPRRMPPTTSTLYWRQDVDYVVSACPTCTVALKHDFIATLKALGRPMLCLARAQLAAKVVDFSTLVKKLVDEGRLTFKEGQQLGKVTYHDSCHLKRTLNVSQEPRELLTKAGYEISEMYEADMCCGMGGSYSLKLPEISAPILERKLTNIKSHGRAAGGDGLSRLRDADSRRSG